MYIGGIHIPGERLALGVESAVTSSIFIYTAAAFYVGRNSMKVAEEKGGQIKSMPKTFLGKLVTSIHAIGMMLPVVTYLIAVPLNGCAQPDFISRFALPNFGLGQDSVYLLRIASAVGLIGTWKLFRQCVDLLGNSGTYHQIGVRERPKLITSGPFAVVRHPLYTCALLQNLILTGMTWNYIPLYALAIITIAFAIKAPIEESLMESDSEIGLQYKVYKEKVPYRLIPGVW
ncbi:uncharacterized protein FOMMEDRAFT_24068 [Fomitiporia mediterranea MF3/22]|uniref:uncharacterized protein n=1 Tax=Fomitiporia mediterranea (strain MF3/22) TaxID=694068 RepID=UPI000440932E|nr:uncharacterized protein FOMMEDRAFT_24068 [Fomitiporia mediterranea MF3/22]EJC98042.1 hypothetical protein FOMMEDRAFT_24068 [Fomitiporia mediterranea MF3/22]